MTDFSKSHFNKVVRVTPNWSEIQSDLEEWGMIISTDAFSSQIHPGLALTHNTLRVPLILTSVPHENVTKSEPETQVLAQSQDSDYD